MGRQRQFEPLTSSVPVAPAAERRQGHSNGSFQDFVATIEYRPMSALKVLRSGVPKMVEDRKIQTHFFSQRPLGNALEHTLMRSLGSAAVC